MQPAMLTEISTPEKKELATSSPAASARPQRVLACVLCQQRKVKCDRKSPCANCVKCHTQCVPATKLVPRQRRRRFPERELLDRLRHYETLLRRNNVTFEPLHNDLSNTEAQSLNAEEGDDFVSQGDEQPRPVSGSPSTTDKSESVYKAKNFWHAVNQRLGDSDEDGSDSSRDDVNAAVLTGIWDHSYQGHDHLLFGSPKTALELATLHPDQVQIFRLWQIYLDNVNPLLKITHAPTLQGRIVSAASDVTSIQPCLAALMFGIYCVSILSLGKDECYSMFGSSQEGLLSRYQFSCQQALWNCGFLRSTDRECLTALYFYLISVKTTVHAQSLFTMLGLAIRIAQRMGLDSESAHAKHPVFEAEMRRRLWWSLVLFDSRVSETAVYKSVLLVPTWDCRTPLNVNDFDLQPDMKEAPTVQGGSTEALFAVVRSEISDFVRHSAFHLDFTLPVLKAVAKNVQRGPLPETGELTTLEKLIEDNYVRVCNPENPLHFMTIWTARSLLAKNRLFEAFSRFSKLSLQQTDAQRDIILSYALTTITCDTKLMTSPLTRRYLWLHKLYTPLLAYIHVCQELKKRPVNTLADRTWEIMSDNFEARFSSIEMSHNPFFKIIIDIITHAWEAREALSSPPQKPPVPPRIISSIRQRVAQSLQDAQNAKMVQPSDGLGMGIDDLSSSMPMGLDGHGMLFGIGMGDQSYETLGTGHVQPSLDIDLNQLDWNAMDWSSIQGQT